MGLTPSRTPAWGAAPVPLVAAPPAMAESVLFCVCRDWVGGKSSRVRPFKTAGECQIGPSLAQQLPAPQTRRAPRGGPGWLSIILLALLDAFDAALDGISPVRGGVE